MFCRESFVLENFCFCTHKTQSLSVLFSEYVHTNFIHSVVAAWWGTCQRKFLNMELLVPYHAAACSLCSFYFHIHQCTWLWQLGVVTMILPRHGYENSASSPWKFCHIVMKQKLHNHENFYSFFFFRQVNVLHLSSDRLLVCSSCLAKMKNRSDTRLKNVSISSGIESDLWSVHSLRSARRAIVRAHCR